MCVRAAALVLASRTVAILRRAIRAEAIVPERSLILDRGPDIETDLVHVCAEHRDLDRVEQCRLAGTVGAEEGRVPVDEDVLGLADEVLDQDQFFELLHSRASSAATDRKRVGSGKGV